MFGGLTLISLAQPSPSVPLVHVWSNACRSANITVANPSCGPLPVGNIVPVEVNVTNAPAFNGFEFYLFYDPNFISATDIDLDTGTVFGSGNPNNLALNPFSPLGTVKLNVVNFATPAAYTGANGTLAHINFRILQVGVSPLALSAGIPSVGGAGTQLLSAGVSIQVDTSDGYFRNQPAGDPSVVYDSDGDGLFDVGETVLSGAAPADQTGLKDDPKIKYRDTNNSGVWNSTEGVFYDSNLNNAFDQGEKVIYGDPEPGSLSDDPKISYVDANGNSSYDPSKLGPVASFSYTPSSPRQGDRITFDAANSFDHNAGVLSTFRWDIGLSSTEIGQSPTYSVPYLVAGSHSVRLTVTDVDDNFMAMEVQRVDVEKQDLHDLKLGSFGLTPTEVQPGQNITINAIVSNYGPFSEIFNLTVTYGAPAVLVGQAPNQNITVAALTYQFSLNTTGLAPGFYTVQGNVSLVRDDVPGDNIALRTFRVLGEESPLSQSPLFLAIGGGAAIAALAAVIVLLRRRRPKEDAD